MNFLSLLQALVPNDNSAAQLDGLDVNVPPRALPQVMDTQQPSVPNLHTTLPPVLLNPSATPTKSRSKLQNILGVLGDALAERDGLEPRYRQTRDRERLSEAMGGLGDDPMAAINRIAQLPIEGAAEMAQKMYSDLQTQELRRATQANTAANQKLIDQDRDAARENTKLYRREQQLLRFTPLAGALVNDPSIRTKEDYTKAYNRALTAAKRIDPEITGADLGLWDPEDWAPGRGSTVGLTQGENVRNQTTQRGQNMTDARGRRGQDMAQSRNAASINASLARATIAAKGGGGGAGPVLPPGLRPGGAATPAAAGNNLPTLSPREAAKLPKGTKFKGTDGKTYTR